MDEKKYQLQARQGLFISNDELDKLFSLPRGDAALLYLWLLRSGGVLAQAEAARSLGRSSAQIREAEEQLRQVGLLVPAAAAAPAREARVPVILPAEELPEYKAEDILRRSREDGAFQALLAEAEARLGHHLSGADMKTLFGIYDRLGLPCEVIMLVINRCAEVARRRYGEGRLPTMRAIEKEAYAWCNREIMTLEQAEEYLAALDRRDEAAEALQQLLQMHGRTPTATERKYMDSWLSMGFPRETLELAYDRTVVGTGGKFVWKYMDAILRAWQEKGLYTPADVERGDTRPQRQSARPAAAVPARGEGSRQGDDLARLERMLGKKE